MNNQLKMIMSGIKVDFSIVSNHIFSKTVQATLLNPDMCNPDFCLNRTDWKVPVPSFIYNCYTRNTDFALSGLKFRVHISPD